MTRKILALAVMGATALSTIATPANAAVTVLGSIISTGPNSTTLAAMATQCNALAALHGSNWHGTVDIGSIVPSGPVSGPTEVGSHSIGDAIGDPVGAGTFTPAHTDILGDPYRNGGSVNMFGIKEAVGGHYSASQYDFLGDFETQWSYAFNCNMTETVHIPVQGYYVVDDNHRGADETAIRANCDAFTAMGPDASQPWWGQDHAFCAFVVTQAAHDEDQDRSDEAGTPVLETQTDYDVLAHESYGEGFDTSETLIIGQVVVCISPSKTGTKLPGSWVQQNGYTGSKCTTDWYNGGAKVGVPNLNDGSHNWVTVPVV